MADSEKNDINYKRKSHPASSSDSQEHTDAMIEDGGLIEKSEFSMDDDDQGLTKNDENEETMVVESADNEDDDSSMTAANQILEGDNAMASLTLKKEDEKKKDKLDWKGKKKRTRTRAPKMMKHSDICARLDAENEKMGEGSGVKIAGEEETGEEMIDDDSVSEEENDESPASSSGSEERLQPMRLFSKSLTDKDTARKLHFTSEQMEQFHFSQDVTAELRQPGRTVTLQIVDERGENWEMKLQALQYADGGQTRYCISSGWTEFFVARNLEVGDEIIFYRSPTSNDTKELILEFIKPVNPEELATYNQPLDLSLLSPDMITNFRAEFP